MEAKRALVCGGGGLKVYWLAGKLWRLAQEGFEYDFSVGTSAGALATGFISSRRAAAKSFKTATEELVAFLRTIEKPSDVIKKRSTFDLAWDLAHNRWRGLYDTTPLLRLLADQIKTSRPGDLAVISDMVTRQSWGTQINPWSVLASASEPILAKPVDRTFVDGGLREICPLSVAIKYFATDIYALVTQVKPSGQEIFLPDVRELSLFEQIDATIGAMTSEIVENDIALTEAYNQLVIAGKPAKPEHVLVNLFISRAPRRYNGNYADFTKKQTEEMLEEGMA